MPLRPGINLAAQQADLTTVLPLFQQAREFQQRRSLMPLEQQLTQQAVDSGDIALNEDRRDALTRSVVEGAAMVKPHVDRGDFQGAMRALQQRRASLQAQGIDTSNTDEAIALLQQDPNAFVNSVEALVEFGNQSGILGRGQAVPVALQERQALLRDAEGAFDEQGQVKPREQLTPKQISALTDLNVIPRLVGSSRITEATTPGLTSDVAESEEVIEGAKASGKVTGKGIETRRVERINTGVDAARGIPTLKRALLLLERVETGGPEAMELALKQRLGAETADEGELSNKLGKAVLSQLRAIFGPQFTEREGQRLDDIEANFRRNTAVNKRLLNELLQFSEKKAKQAIKDAVAIEDFDTAASIKASMDAQFDENSPFLPGLDGPSEQPSDSENVPIDSEIDNLLNELDM